jgi:hypothetical protein
MGSNLKCASCHDSFINNWKLADAYGMAGIYSQKPLEMVRCDVPQGRAAPVRFMYPQLGSIDANAPRSTRLERLAAILTGRRNGRLARTMANRLWAKLMGRGLVEPADVMDNRPWHADLLDWLAADFADNGFDIKKTIGRIAASRAYQLPSMSLKTEQARDFVFSGPGVKRISAEQFVDAVATLTGVWQKPAASLQVYQGRIQIPWSERAVVKFDSGVMKTGSAEIDVEIGGARVLSLVVADGGDSADYDWADWISPRLEGPAGTLKLNRASWRSATTGYGNVQIDKSVVEKPLRVGDRTYPEGIGAHASSIITYVIPEGYTRFRATAGPDAGGVESGGGRTSIQFLVVTGDLSLVQARAALAVADPLMRALGRPNREQVVTQRSSVATTLQALELTNGQTLASMLSEGARRLREAAGPGGSTVALVNRLYEQALGRLPSAAERSLALKLVGSPARGEGLEDLLWSLVMLPEFQLVY